VAHEAARDSGQLYVQTRRSRAIVGLYLVILSSMLRGSRMNVGSTTLLKSAPGRSCEMM
jgi:hypothetical protein